METDDKISSNACELILSWELQEISFSDKTVNVGQTDEDLKKHLAEQLYFLRKSANEYDKGDEIEAKRMTVNLRNLLHDFKNSSKSLLSQLGFKDRIKFLNTAVPYIPSHFIPYTGLVSGGIRINQQFMEYQYEPLLHKTFALGQKDRWLTFEEWWEKKPIIIDLKKNVFTRKDLVLCVSNQDGGVHVNKMKKKYAELSRHNSLGWNILIKFPDGSEKKITPKHLELACIRQIAYEIEQTLKIVMQPTHPFFGIN